MPAHRQYYIIEHPTRGVLQRKLAPNLKLRFSWVKSRDHEDNARYYILAEALRAVYDAKMPAGDLKVFASPAERGGLWTCVHGEGV